MKILLISILLGALAALTFAAAQEPGSGSSTPPLISTKAELPYPVFYVRAPVEKRKYRVQEVIEPTGGAGNTDLMMLPKWGKEPPVTFVDAGPREAVADSKMSLDGQWVYYSKYENIESRQRWGSQLGAPRGNADIYKKHIATGEVIRLTNGIADFAPNTGNGTWAKDPRTDSLRSGSPLSLGYGIFNLGAQPLPGGKVAFSSNRLGYRTNRPSQSGPGFQCFVLDEATGAVENITPMSIGSCLHPTLLQDGRLMFSSYESQGFRDGQKWSLWYINPDGSEWGPVFSNFSGQISLHFQTQGSNGDIYSGAYYFANDYGAGTILRVPDPTPSLAAGRPIFQSASKDASTGFHVACLQNVKQFEPNKILRRWPYLPIGVSNQFAFAHPSDHAACRDDGGQGRWLGKVTHPAAAPGPWLLAAHTGESPSNHLNRPTTQPWYEFGIVIASTTGTVNHPSEMQVVIDDPKYFEMQPIAGVSWAAIHGEDPPELPWRQREPEFKPGDPFGAIGTSSILRHGAAFGKGNNTGRDKIAPLVDQGGLTGPYAENDVTHVRIIYFDPDPHQGSGPWPDGFRGREKGFKQTFPDAERLSLAGEIPIRKFKLDGTPILDLFGKPDTSFRARIQAGVPWTIQAIGTDGDVRIMSQTWHQIMPGEVRVNCGGCHAHAQAPLDFATTAAARPDYPRWDLGVNTPLLTPEGELSPNSGVFSIRPFWDDVAPILQKIGLTNWDAVRALIPGKRYHIRGSALYSALQESPGITGQDILDVTRWVNLGMPAPYPSKHAGSYMQDNQRPTIHLYLEDEILYVGMFDHQTGLDLDSLKISINGEDRTGEFQRDGWRWWKNYRREDGPVLAEVKDNEGNHHKSAWVVSHVAVSVPPEPEPPPPVEPPPVDPPPVDPPPVDPPPVDPPPQREKIGEMWCYPGSVPTNCNWIPIP